MTDRILYRVGDYWKKIEDRLSAWNEEDFNRRLWSKDPTLWFSQEMPEISDRLGWLEYLENAAGKIKDWENFSKDIKDFGISQIVLLGMGGSSLAPEVFQKVLGSNPGYPSLCVLDSTHPKAILDLEESLDLSRTFFLVSSKSGTTLETLSFFYYFWDRMRNVAPHPGDHFAAITDHDTPLMKLAVEKKFRKIFEAPGDVGGRFSALTEFGLVPAALIGLDIQNLLDKARRAAKTCGSIVPSQESPGLILGASLGEIAVDRDKLTFLASESLEDFPDWLEQLVAESLGKEGKGIIPVTREPDLKDKAYGHDRFFVGFFLDDDRIEKLKQKLYRLENQGHPVIHIHLHEISDLTQEMFLWKIAVSSAGSILNVHPFNQPDVQLAKEFTNEAIKRDEPLKESEKLDSVSADRIDDLAYSLENWLNLTSEGDYIAIQAFFPSSSEIISSIQSIREKIAEKMCLPVTFGFGPRFLHSTGQLHKGGPDKGLFLQLVDAPDKEASIPESDNTFNSLIGAQSAGDYRALKKLQRRILRIDLGSDVQEALRSISSILLRGS
jgi:transaldolase/glucose-6-phosphate isomerase